MKTMLMLLLAFAGSLSAQSYAVSDGTQAYPWLVGPTVETAGHDGATAEISPQGFAFPYFGQVCHSFRICTNGSLVLGNGAFNASTSKTPDHAAFGNVVACLWTDLILSSAGALRWKFDAGVLAVEWYFVLEEYGAAWQPIPMPGVCMQTRLDMSTGTITCLWADPSPMAYVVTQHPGAVAISSTAGASQQVVVGEVPGCVAADGSVVQYPVGRSVTFTPPADTAPVISASTNGAVLSDGQVLNVAMGATLASLGLQFTADDADGDPLVVTGGVGNSSGTGIVSSEFCGSGGAPLTLTPTSGGFGASGDFPVSLQADDGRGGTASISFTIRVTAGGSSSGAGRGGGSGGCIAGACGTAFWCLLLPLMRRRKRA